MSALKEGLPVKRQLDAEGVMPKELLTGSWGGGLPSIPPHLRSGQTSLPPPCSWSSFHWAPPVPLSLLPSEFYLLQEAFHADAPATGATVLAAHFLCFVWGLP